MAWTAPKTWTVGEVLTAAGLNTHLRDNLLAADPVGSLKYVIAPSAGAATANVVNGGWLEANGAAVSRATYSELDTLLASLTPARPFGAGDGSTTFTLPDLRGRVPYAIGGATDVSTLGNNDTRADNARTPKHAHQTNVNRAGVGSPGSEVAGELNTDDGWAPYLVAGIWIVKF